MAATSFLPAHAWCSVFAFLDRADLVHMHVGLSAHVADCNSTLDASGCVTWLMTHTGVASSFDRDGQLERWHPRSCGHSSALTWRDYESDVANEKRRCCKTHELLTDSCAALRHGNSDDRHHQVVLPPLHSSTIALAEMSSRQIVPQSGPAPLKPKDKVPRQLSGAKASSLVILFQRLALSRHNRALHRQRASWPLGRTEQPEGFAKRARQSLANAWATIHRDSSSEALIARPHFLRRAKRSISQRFNLKVVKAVSKDVRRIESSRRDSVLLLETPGSASSLTSVSSTSSTESSHSSDVHLRLSERLSLSLGRRISRDFAPMLTEGTALERRVREMVYSALRDATTFEGHVCTTFFAKQEEFTSTQPEACRYYLNRVRDTITDLVEFIIEYRLLELGERVLPDNTPSNQPIDDEALARELENAVRRAVEEYFCFSLRYEIRHWCAGATEVEHRSRFKRTLAKWSALPSTSREFGLKTSDAHLESQPLVAHAINKLRDLETIATPSRKMESLLAACHALGEFIAQSRGDTESSSHDDDDNNNATTTSMLPALSPTSRVCLGDADSFLPLLIFAVTRSGVRDPFAQCALLLGLYPFDSQFGERMYYLTMFEASLEFLRTHS